MDEPDSAFCHRLEGRLRLTQLFAIGGAETTLAAVIRRVSWRSLSPLHAECGPVMASLASMLAGAGGSALACDAE